MPTSKHEGLIELFRDRPPLAAELVQILGIKLPAWQQARVDSGELPDLLPTQRLADVVTTLTDGSTGTWWRSSSRCSSAEIKTSSGAGRPT